MRKNILFGLLLSGAVLSLASCGEKKPADTTSVEPSTPVTDSTTGSTDPVTSTPVTDPITSTPVTDPITSDPITSVPTTTEKPFTLVETTVFMVGDSTMCSFTDDYMYPRYGYGTQMASYLDDNEYALVKNYAMSGRSSLSFIKENNYKYLEQEISEGDYLIIGFGHNDEKEEDATRFRSAKYANIEAALADEDSFQRSLYDNYVKLALDAGATPILASPIVRLNKSNDYSGSSAHNTTNGDYAKAVRELADYYDIAFVDLTEITKAEYTKLGYDEAIYYHAMTAGRWTDETKTEIEPKLTSVDATHINIYGAKNVAYLFTEALKETDCNLKYYVNPDNVKPTIDDLVMNPNYTPKDYEVVDYSKYEYDESYAENFKTTTANIYGTAFGELGGAGKIVNMKAKETTNDTDTLPRFEVGNSTTKNGKLTASSAGFAYAFMPIPANKNYSLKATVEVLEYVSTTQAGFGLMIRDDCYVPTSDTSLVGNCICAGYNTISSSSSSQVNFGYEGGALFQEEQTTTIYGVGTTLEITITRLGQNITIVTKASDTLVFENTYYDFDIFDTDTQYYYLGMFATRGTVAEFSNVQYTYISDYEGA